MTALPTELWGKIFSWSIDDCVGTDGLTIICRTWRNIAESSPLLWTALILRHPRHFVTPGKIDKWLANSADCPIDVIIDALSGTEDILPVAKLLSKHVFRFRTLDMRLYAYAHITQITQILPILALDRFSSRPAPLLETLYIDWSSNHVGLADDYLSALESGFSPCPCLKNIALPALFLPPAYSKIFANVTHLILSDTTGHLPSVKDMLNIFRHAPYVSKFTYSGMDEFSYQSLDSLNLVSAPALTTVDLTAPGCGLDVLRYLDAPSLSDIRLDGWRGYGNYVDWNETLFDCVRDAFTGLSDRSRHVRRIDLHHINMRKHDYKCLFQEFPELGWLRLISTDITDQALASAICPKLMHLEFQGCDYITVRGVLGLVAGRGPMGGPCFELSIDDCKEICSTDGALSFPPSVSWILPSPSLQHRWAH